MIALKLEDLSMAFGGVPVLNDISLEIPQGARHVIFGPNGAGKTTLFRLISGELTPQTGEIELFGRNVTGDPVWKRARRGLGRTFQVSNLFPDLTVEEAIHVACQANEPSRGFVWRGQRRASSRVRAKVNRMLEQESLTARAATRISSLGQGEQRLLEIALANATEPELLLLDEPTAGLPAHGVKSIEEQIAGLSGSVTVVMIEHDLEVAFRVSTTATVLVHGQVVANDDLSAVRNDPTVRHLYLGDLVDQIDVTSGEALRDG